jgi:hypothetical protein
MFRRHGIVGGPKQNPVKPRKIPGFMPKRKPAAEVEEAIDVVVVDSDEPLDLEEKELDAVEQDDVLDEYIPVGVFDTEYKCGLCEFTTKSERGLGVHMRWHTTTAASSQEQ